MVSNRLSNLKPTVKWIKSTIKRFLFEFLQSISDAGKQNESDYFHYGDFAIFNDDITDLLAAGRAQIIFFTFLYRTIGDIN